MTKSSYDSKKDDVTKHYEKQWEDYSQEDVIERVRNLSSVLDSIVSNIPIKNVENVLDLGSGPGIIPLRISRISERNPKIKVLGIDISDKALQIGRKVVDEMDLGESIQFIKGDCENLPFQECGYDAVVSNATINLLEDKHKAFSEIARITKPGGYIIIGDCIAAEGKECSTETEKSDDLWSKCVSGAPTKGEMLELAKGADLEVIKTEDLTDEVARLVKNELWDWPEFTEHDLEYNIFVMRKGNDSTSPT
jgi:ubiquinone/menaquinone biosynthesis C-methylase UbiE